MNLHLLIPGQVQGCCPGMVRCESELEVDLLSIQAIPGHCAFPAGSPSFDSCQRLLGLDNRIIQSSPDHRHRRPHREVKIMLSRPRLKGVAPGPELFQMARIDSAHADGTEIRLKSTQCMLVITIWFLILKRVLNVLLAWCFANADGEASMHQILRLLHMVQSQKMGLLVQKGGQHVVVPGCSSPFSSCGTTGRICAVVFQVA